MCCKILSKKFKSIRCPNGVTLGYLKTLNKDKYVVFICEYPLDFLDAPSPSSSFKDEVKMSLLIRAVSSQPATRPKLAQPTASPSRQLGPSQPIGKRRAGNVQRSSSEKVRFFGVFLVTDSGQIPTFN